MGLALGTHLRNSYAKEGILGHGAFARVFKVRHKKTKKLYAAKSIPKAKLDGDLRQLVDTEIKILTEIKHPNCCNLVEYFESEKKIYLIQELMHGPTLYERFTEDQDLTEWHVAVVTQKIAKALEYLHSKGIVHRDLKPQNIMFAKPTKEDPNLTSLKILDFGFAKHVKSNGFTTSSRGTPRYVGPEVVFKNKHGKIEYGTSCDMWSLGVIVYELLSGWPPFPDKPTLPEYFKEMKRCSVEFPDKYFRTVSKEAKELILLLLEKKPKRRYTASQVLKHPWITTNCQFDDIQSKISTEVSVSRLDPGRQNRMKILLGIDKLKRVVQFLVLMSRLRSCMDNLLTMATGEGADSKLADIVNVKGVAPTTKSSADFRKFVDAIRQHKLRTTAPSDAKTGGVSCERRVKHASEPHPNDGFRAFVGV